MKNQNGNPERVNFTLPTQLLKLIREEAENLDRSASWVIRKAMTEYFQRNGVVFEKEVRNEG